MVSRAEPANPPQDGEDGFTLVEVLVTLVIAAMLALVVGGLISFAVGLRDRSERSNRTISAVLDLEALRNVILEAAGPADHTEISKPTETGFALSATASARPHLPIAVGIVRKQPDGILSVSLSFAGDETMPATSVNLSPFDEASIDYLGGTGNHLAWQSSGSLIGAPLAARLTVVQGKRRWTIPLWIMPQGNTQ